MWNFFENLLFCFDSCLFGKVLDDLQDVSCIVCFGRDIYYKASQHFRFSCTKVLDDFQIKFLPLFLAFLQGLYLNSSSFKDYSKTLTMVSEKQCCDKKANWVKKVISKKSFLRFYVIIAANTGFRSAALEQCKNTTNSKPIANQFLCSCVCDMDHESAIKYHYYYN